MLRELPYQAGRELPQGRAFTEPDTTSSEASSGINNLACEIFVTAGGRGTEEENNDYVSDDELSYEGETRSHRNKRIERNRDRRLHR